MKYGVYVLTKKGISVRMISKYDGNGSDGWELVGTANTKKKATEIFKSLTGNFIN